MYYGGGGGETRNIDVLLGGKGEQGTEMYWGENRDVLGGGGAGNSDVQLGGRGIKEQRCFALMTRKLPPSDDSHLAPYVVSLLTKCDSSWNVLLYHGLSLSLPVSLCSDTCSGCL